MKIYVFSDSHRACAAMAEVLTQNKGDYDTVIHLGDRFTDCKALEPILGVTPLITLRGNCDSDTPDPSVLPSYAVELYGIRFFLCHGHEQSVKTTYDVLFNEARRYGCRAALFGHTHVPLCETRGGITIFNPGSIGVPYPPRKPSYGVITIEGDLVMYEIREV